MLSLLLLLGSAQAIIAQQHQSEVPGDFFSLEGALELFKKSSSPEEFERMLNSSDSKVNNLDLNGDGEIDYIRVIDRNEGTVHAFILQAIVSDSESQDVAVIELEKLANGKAVLQITGDEDIYGIETIIEPTEEVRIHAGTATTRTVVNVWAWPSVQYVYGPSYTVWVSPWHWHYRPFWWSSWRPVVYHDYYTWWEPYRPYYSRCHTHRIVYAHEMYRPHRTASVIVYTRHQTQLTHYRSSHRSEGDERSSREKREGSLRNGAIRNDDNSSRSSEWKAGEKKQRSRTFANSRNDIEPNRSGFERKPSVRHEMPAVGNRVANRKEYTAPTRRSGFESTGNRDLKRSSSERTYKSAQPRESKSIQRTERSKPVESPVLKRSTNDRSRKKSD